MTGSWTASAVDARDRQPVRAVVMRRRTARRSRGGRGVHRRGERDRRVARRSRTAAVRQFRSTVVISVRRSSRLLRFRQRDADTYYLNGRARSERIGRHRPRHPRRSIRHQPWPWGNCPRRRRERSLDQDCAVGAAATCLQCRTGLAPNGNAYRLEMTYEPHGGAVTRFDESRNTRRRDPRSRPTALHVFGRETWKLVMPARVSQRAA